MPTRLSLALRVFAVALTLGAVSTGLFAWRWPDAWRLPVRPGGTLKQPPADMQSQHSVAPTESHIGWMLLMAVMTLLVVGWLLMVVLT